MTATAGDNERSGIAACAKAAAINDNLIDITDDVSSALAAAGLILHVHARIDRPDCSGGSSGGSPALFHCQSDGRGYNDAANGPNPLDETGAIHQAVPQQGDRSVNIRPESWSGGKICDDSGRLAAVIYQTGLRNVFAWRCFTPARQNMIVAEDVLVGAIRD